MTLSFRTTASLLVLSIASLSLPSLAHAKRMGGGVKPRVSASPKAPVKAAAPAAAPAARGPGMMGTVGAIAVGAVAGSMMGNAIAGSPDKNAKEAEAQALQKKTDEAKHKAEPARPEAK